MMPDKAKMMMKEKEMGRMMKSGKMPLGMLVAGRGKKKKRKRGRPDKMPMRGMGMYA